MPSRPAAAFLVGIGSHLILDACPHWGCDLTTPGGPERFLKIARRDGLVGALTMTAAAVAVSRQARVATIAAMVGSVSLDLDKPFLHFLGVDPFPRIVSKIHAWVQNESPEGLADEIGYGLLFAGIDAMLRLHSHLRTDF
jgi:hypothetical protein